MTKPLKILARFRKRLNLEISRKTDALNLLFILKNRTKGNFTDEDLIELRGYYKGLKVAREILLETIEKYSKKSKEAYDNELDD